MDIDHILFRTDVVTIGRFRCPIGHARFRDSGPIRQSCFVFPRTSVVIEHEGQRPFVTDPTLATLYNTGQRYERRAISADGDRCDWYGVSADLLRDVVRPLDPRAADAPAGAMRYDRTTIDAALYLDQRRLFDAVARSEPLEPLEIEERVVVLLNRVVRSAYAQRPAPERVRTSRAASTRIDVVDAAREFLARTFTERVGLKAIARAAGCSPFHLCRAFRAVTGSTMHGHVTSLRLRAALERLGKHTDLTDVALDSGFSSHSHFTMAFRRAFGVTPSRAFRARF